MSRVPAVILASHPGGGSRPWPRSASPPSVACCSLRAGPEALT